MSIWFKDVETYDGALGAARSGMWASLAFAAMVGLGLVLLLTGNGAMIGVTPQDFDPAARYVAIAMVLAELAVALLAAYRFRLGKGLIAGSATLLIFLLEIVMKLLSGPFLGVLWYIIYLAVFLGLVNGVRGAWARRSMGDAGALGDTFQ
ncbi:MAG TPA: hypothetical protein VGW40_14655 [Allosphingosinicella sp.]|nr:hypothetical protein [Allosphingosinicella sp.]